MSVCAEVQKFVDERKEEFEIVTRGAFDKVVCTLTKHELPARIKDVKEYVEKNKKYLAAKKKIPSKKIDQEFDYSKYEPHITANKKDKTSLFCQLTGTKLNKNPAELEKHMSGRRYQRAKKEFEAMVADDASVNDSEMEDEEEEDDEDGSDVEAGNVFDNAAMFGPSDDEEEEEDDEEEEESPAKRRKVMEGETAIKTEQSKKDSTKKEAPASKKEEKKDAKKEVASKKEEKNKKKAVVTKEIVSNKTLLTPAKKATDKKENKSETKTEADDDEDSDDDEEMSSDDGVEISDIVAKTQPAEGEAKDKEAERLATKKERKAFFKEQQKEISKAKGQVKCTAEISNKKKRNMNSKKKKKLKSKMAAEKTAA